MTTRFTLAIALSATLLACRAADSGSETAAATTSRDSDGVVYAYDRKPIDTTHAPGTIIDSVFPMPEMIRRFRVGLPETSSLRDAPRSKQNLVAQFVTALSTSDKETLGRLTLSRSEYAYVYFPNTPDASRDNGLTPQLGWDQIALESEKGIVRALTRVGGKPTTLEALDCADAPRKQGELTLHAGCSVRLTFGDGTSFNGRLFGAIVEHAGRFKFLGYANDM